MTKEGMLEKAKKKKSKKSEKKLHEQLQQPTPPLHPPLEEPLEEPMSPPIDQPVENQQPQAQPQAPPKQQPQPAPKPQPSPLFPPPSQAQPQAPPQLRTPPKAPSQPEVPPQIQVSPQQLQYFSPPREPPRQPSQPVVQQPSPPPQPPAPPQQYSPPPQPPAPPKPQVQPQPPAPPQQPPQQYSPPKPQVQPQPPAPPQQPSPPPQPPAPPKPQVQPQPPAPPQQPSPPPQPPAPPQPQVQPPVPPQPQAPPQQQPPQPKASPQPKSPEAGSIEALLPPPPDQPDASVYDKLKPEEFDQLQQMLQQPDQLLEQLLEQKIEGILSHKVTPTPPPQPPVQAPPQPTPPAPPVQAPQPPQPQQIETPPKPPEKTLEAAKDTNPILDLVPVKGGIAVDEVGVKLALERKAAKKQAAELGKQGIVRLKKDYVFFGTQRMFCTKWLLKRREENKLSREIVEKKKLFKVVLTPLDSLVDLVRREKKMSVSDLSKILGLKKELIERWAFELKDLVCLEYPANVFSSPVVKIKEGLVEKELPKDMDAAPLETYQIVADKVPALVKIYRLSEESMPFYMVDLPYIGEGTSSILDSVLGKLTDRVRIQAEDISDPKKMNALRAKFFSETKALLQEEIPTSEENIDILAGVILHKAYGLGNVELLMDDHWLEEVCVNTSHIPLTAFHKKYGWMKTNLFIENEKAVYNYAAQIGRKVGRNITNLTPIMDAHLLTGDRVCSTLFPVSSFGNTITIRKFARKPWTITQLISPDFFTLSKEIAAFLWLCFQYELNVIVGGGTASGKTSVLNCLCSLIQPTHRVVSIEDTREINLPTYLYWNWIPLTTREVNPEGKGEVSMLDLIVTSLRMRPDRIIVGEIRRRREAEVLFEAMHTGHSVYSTIHADTARNLQRRLLEPPIQLSSAEVEALHLIVIQHRDRSTGTRKTFEIAEIVPGSDKSGFELNYLFRWNSRAKEFVKINESTRIFDDLMLHTGMTKEEIKRDLKERETVLQWMLDAGVRDIDDVGEVMDRYYKNKEGLLAEIRSNARS